MAPPDVDPPSSPARFAPDRQTIAGDNADIYFERGRQILKAEGLDPQVSLEFFARRRAMLCGVEESVELLRNVSSRQVAVDGLEDGAWFDPGEVVIRISGPYLEFGLYETALLGILSSQSGWATAAADCVAAAAPIPVISFGARHVHPLVSGRMEYAATVGGCDGCATPAGASLSGVAAAGTLPHALVLSMGDTLVAAEAFDRHMPPGVKRIVLVDTFMEEAEESLRVAAAMGDRLHGVRLDTPSELGGVTIDLVERVRHKLDAAGHGHVKIFVSGGFDSERITRMRRAGAPVDGFGVGSAISAAAPIEFTADIKEVEARPVAKRGRVPGRADNPRLHPINLNPRMGELEMKTYDFGGGRTDPASFPVAELAAAAQKAIAEVGSDFVNYPGDLGHPGLREIMAARESQREGVEVSPDHISLTNGSFQAVTLIAEALMERPGDIIVTEELTYSGTIGAYKRMGAQLVGVPLDDGGMCTDALDRTLTDLQQRGTPPRFVYTLATYQNPTGSVMPRARRLELLEVARRHNAIVVEDNCYGDVHFEGEKEPALYALDDSPDVIYLCSLSKIFGPGVRLGYLHARPPMLERILDPPLRRWQQSAGRRHLRRLFQGPAVGTHRNQKRPPEGEEGCGICRLRKVRRRPVHVDPSRGRTLHLGWFSSCGQYRETARPTGRERGAGRFRFLLPRTRTGRAVSSGWPSATSIGPISRRVSGSWSDASAPPPSRPIRSCRSRWPPWPDQ